MTKGIAPLEPGSAVGQLRSQLGDTSFTEIPAEPGFGLYSVFADVALEALLAATGGDVLRAAGNATMTLAMEYSARGRSIKTDDLAIDVRSRGRDLLEVAKTFFAEADAAAQREAEDFFDVAQPFSVNSLSHLY